MFSADLFTTVESFLGAATGFLYSLIFSLLLLIRYPFVAPRLLSRRYKRTDIKQIGPLSLLFVLVALAASTVSSGEARIDKFALQYFDDDKKSNVVTFLVSCFAVTLLLDAVARISAFVMGLFAKEPFAAVFANRLFTARKLRISYALVVPTLAAAIAFNLCIAAIPIVLVPLTSGLNFGQTIVVAIVSVGLGMSIAAGAAGRGFSRYLKTPMPRGRFGRIARHIGAELAIPGIVVLCIVAFSQTQRIAAKDYPSGDARSSVSDGAALEAVDMECVRTKKGHILVRAYIHNTSKNPAILYKNGSLKLVPDDKSKETTFLEMGADASRPVPAALILPSNAISEVSSDVDAGTLSIGDVATLTCEAEWPAHYGTVSTSTSLRQLD